MKDPLQGMKYLHNSAVKLHGNLTSSHCMIDSHWVVSITDWGLNNFKAGQEKIQNNDVNKTYAGMYTIDTGARGGGGRVRREQFR